MLTQSCRTMPLGSLLTSQLGYVAFDVHPSKLSSSSESWGQYRLSAFEGGLQAVSAECLAGGGNMLRNLSV